MILRRTHELFDDEQLQPWFWIRSAPSVTPEPEPVSPPTGGGGVGIVRMAERPAFVRKKTIRQREEEEILFLSK